MKYVRKKHHTSVFAGKLKKNVTGRKVKILVVKKGNWKKVTRNIVTGRKVNFCRKKITEKKGHKKKITGLKNSPEKVAGE